MIESPAKVSEKDWRPTSAIPTAVRKWGYAPNLERWHPGDLVLTRAEEPERASKMIQEVQAEGYGVEASVWTHAAVYMGDGLMLCEAQIDPPKACSVIIAKIWDYVGSHHLLVKRSRHAESIEKGWAIATAAATKIGSAYDVAFIAKLAIDRTFVGDKIWQKDQQGKVSAGAFVCSSLYSTAHAYATGVSITDHTNGLCVPAYLAGLKEPHLLEVGFDWHRIPQ